MQVPCHHVLALAGPLLSNARHTLYVIFLLHPQAGLAVRKHHIRKV